MTALDQTYIPWLVALGIGLLIGTERERRKGEGPDRDAAGIRTFTIASLAGAVAMHVGGMTLVAVVAAGIALLAALAYLRSSSDDPGLTTELALIITPLLGALTVAEPLTAAALAVAVASLLALRTPLHRFVRETLTPREVQSALVLAAATLIVWPLLPDRPMGPLAAINPYVIWSVVVLILAIGAAGHIAVRILGPGLGLPLTGFLSGFVSSSATIASMGGKVATDARLLSPAVAGAVFSTVATVVQATAILAATSSATLVALALPLALAGAVSMLYGLVFAFRLVGSETGTMADTGEAFSLRSALVLAALISIVLFAVAILRLWLGNRGVLVAAGVAGFADAHSPIAAVAAQASAGTLNAGEARIPVLAALTTNTITKTVLAVTSGTRAYALRVVPGLVLVIVAAWLGLWLQSS